MATPKTAKAPVLKNLSSRSAAYSASLDFFLAPLAPFLNDEQVTEIMVNGPDRIFVEKGGQIELTGARFASEADVQAAANNIAQFIGHPLSEDRPILDGRLPDGSRVCIVLGPITERGTQINIRRFVRSAVAPQFLLAKKAITEQAMEFLALAVKSHRNIIVSGGAGSGKTTLLNVLSTAFGPAERIVVIEDTRELQIQHDHVVQMEARAPDAYGRGQVSVRDLFVTSLRMRPDRIVVGEVRRGEALDLIQAMTSGHRGALATLHAATPADTCHRLETMALMADVGIPLFALRRQVASAIDLLVQVARLPSGRRLVTHISEVAFDEQVNHYVLTDLFALQGEERQLEWTGRPSRMATDADLDGLVGDINLTKPILLPEKGGAL